MVRRAGLDFVSLCVMTFCFLCFFIFFVAFFLQRHQSFRKRKLLERAYGKAKEKLRKKLEFALRYL